MTVAAVEQIAADNPQAKQFAALFAVPPLTPAISFAVREAWGDVIDPREWLTEPGYDDYNGFGGGYGAGLFDRRDNRANGEDYPTFRTENDLSRIRAIGNFFATASPGGVGALGSLANYTFAAGFKITAQAAEGVSKETVGDDLLATVQRVINALLERNDFFGMIDREIDHRARRSGEALVVLDRVNGWQTDLRFAEPSQLTEPGNTRPIEDWLSRDGIVDCDSFHSSWTFGVHTRDGRHDKPLGYHCLWNPSGTDWDYLPASRVCHVKRNVDLCVKRGISDFYACYEFLSHSEKLLRNSAVGGAIQAAIPYVKEYAEKITKDQITTARDAVTTAVNRTNPFGGREAAYLQKQGPGTVPLAKGWSFKDGPGGDNRSAGFIEVIQAAIRYVGIRWSMPEYMISGDASNGTYSSTLVAESPFVKAREADQQFYATHFRKLVWKAIGIAFEGGYFRSSGVSSLAELQAVVSIKIDAPDVASRDGLKSAQEMQILVNAGAMAISTMATKSGLDHKEELAAGAKPAAPMGFGQPGQPGQIGPNGQPLNPQAGAQPSRTPAQESDDSEDGRWVTLDGGARVMIGSDGTIEKGPDSFVGKKPSELDEISDFPSDAKVIGSGSKKSKSSDAGSIPYAKHGIDEKTVLSAAGDFSATDKIKPTVTFVGEKQGQATYKVQLRGDGVTADRTLTYDTKSKEWSIHNDYLTVSNKGQGIGGRIFASQVETARANGFASITTRAEKGPGFVGYTVWPKFGYDAPLTWDALKNLPPSLKGAETVLDLYAKKGGREHWEKYGDTVDMTFDLSKGSRSNKVFDKYMAKRGRGAKEAAEGNQGSPSNPQATDGRRVDEPDFTAADIAMADAVWDEMQGEPSKPNKITEAIKKACGLFRAYP